MEYIEGKTIGALISERGRIPPSTAVRLSVKSPWDWSTPPQRPDSPRRQPVQHHGDSRGCAKLADLGLAIVTADEDRVTREGSTLGTFDYVAPEQARTRRRRLRSDIYSFGCTIYHMWTGNVPFPGPSLPEKLLGHQTIDPTPLSRMVPGLPEGLSEVVRRMMRKSPDQRYATPMQVARALGPYEDDPAGVGNREVEPPLLRPLGGRAGAAVHGPVASTRGRARRGFDRGGRRAGRSRIPPGADANPDSRPSAASAAPLLTPDDEFEDTADEILRLILDPEPEPSRSGGPSQPGPRSLTDGPASADFAAWPVGWLAPFWPWRFVVLAVMLTVLAVILLGLIPGAGPPVGLQWIDHRNRPAK